MRLVNAKWLGTASGPSPANVLVGLGPKGEGGVVRETSEHHKDPEDLDERDTEIARADSIAEIYADAALELAEMDAGVI
jgi:hypothetical protein